MTAEVETTEEQVVKLKDSQVVIAYLAEKFPNCFTIKGAAKPLKIGIFQELAESLKDDDKVSKTVLRSALRKYTSSWRYLESVKLDADRVDLQGTAVAKIEAEHAEHAEKQLVESKQKAAERRKQNKPARKKANVQTPDRAKKSNFKSKKDSDKSKAKPAAKPARDPSLPLTVGEKVQVLLGNSPVSCTLQEISGNDVVVMTNSGMTIKTEKNKIV
ncbi:hypothetical protein XM47_03825 [Catenovulum maritimum]|uniref:RNA chaperone ProQ n=1 Tax=Catenovulum maritimum TaxID=1513271 RepID=A0A0J8GUK7_9ALTE|nr:hypothetical protein XM47_03825 [Catenovulum maritimum]